jgi:hypothetical protein
MPEGLKLGRSAMKKKDGQKKFCQQHPHIWNKSRKFQVLNLCWNTRPAMMFQNVWCRRIMKATEVKFCISEESSLSGVLGRGKVTDASNDCNGFMFGACMHTNTYNTCCVPVLSHLVIEGVGKWLRRFSKMYFELLNRNSNYRLAESYLL